MITMAFHTILEDRAFVEISIWSYIKRLYNKRKGIIFKCRIVALANSWWEDTLLLTELAEKPTRVTGYFLNFTNRSNRWPADYGIIIPINYNKCPTNKAPGESVFFTYKVKHKL